MGTVSIPLTRGQVAIIDEEDAPLIMAFKWHVLPRPTGGYYATRTERRADGTRHHVLMHRVIAGALDGEEVDHWDGDGLNNTRKNLRRCTKAQNIANRRTPRTNKSGYKGVFCHPRRKKNPWQAYFFNGERQELLGCFPTAELGAEAYNAAAIQRHGEFAFLNDIDYDHPRPRPSPPIPRREKAIPSGQPGVHFDGESGKWRARIYVNGKRVYLGRFATIEEAMRAIADSKC